MKMAKFEDIQEVASQIEELWNAGKTPIVTVEYGSDAAKDLMDFYEDIGSHPTLLDLDGKSPADVEMGLDTIKNSMDFMEKKTVIPFISFRSEQNLKDAVSIAAELGLCVLIKKAWNQEGIEVGSI